jgi:hypothetical protein
LQVYEFFAKTRNEKQSPIRIWMAAMHSISSTFGSKNGRPVRLCGRMSGERRWARPLELDVAARAVAIDHLAEKNGTSVTELRYESPELVAGISHGERLASLGHPVACENLHTRRCGKLSRIEPEMPGEFLIQPN